MHRKVWGKGATQGLDSDWSSLESPWRGSGCQAPTHTGDRRPLLGTMGVGMGLTADSAPPPSLSLPLPGAPTARTYSAWVKALSPSGTVVSPFPEQSTRRSPSQLQGAAQRGGAAPLGSAEPRSPRAKKQSSPSGPGIAAAASRAGLSRGAARSACLRYPPPPPRSRPAGWGRALSAVVRARPL